MQDNLHIHKTRYTPEILFESSGKMLISGRSIPEHPIDFYEPALTWIKNFLNSKPSFVELTIYLDYLNTHSTECMLFIYKRFSKYYKDHPTSDVKIIWRYDEDDEDILTLGEDLASLSSVPVVYQQIND